MELGRAFSTKYIISKLLFWCVRNLCEEHNAWSNYTFQWNKSGIMMNLKQPYIVGTCPAVLQLSITQGDFTRCCCCFIWNRQILENFMLQIFIFLKKKVDYTNNKIYFYIFQFKFDFNIILKYAQLLDFKSISEIHFIWFHYTPFPLGCQGKKINYIYFFFHMGYHML